MKSMCKHWGLYISTNINRLSAVLGTFWAVWRVLLWCLKAKLRSWRFPRYWRFNKWYHGGYQLICLISRPILIASRRDWYWSKGLFKGFKLAIRPWESSKNWWRYGRMKFVTDHMEEEENKSRREPETTVEDTGGWVCPAKIKQVQGATQVQWIWTKEEEKTEPAICAGSGAIWSKIARRNGRRGELLWTSSEIIIIISHSLTTSG